MAQTSPVHTTQNLDCLFFFGVTRCLCAPRQCWVFFLFSPVHSVFNNMRPYGRPSQQYFCSISLRICIEYSGMWQESLCLEKQKQFCWCRRSAQSGRSQTCTLLSLLPMGILSPGAGVGVTWTGSARQCADNSTVLTTCDPVNQFVFWLCCI